MTLYVKFKTGKLTELHDVDDVDHDGDTIYVYMEDGTIKRCHSCAVKYFTIEYSTGQCYTCYPAYENHC